MAPQPWMRSARTIPIPAQTNPIPAANGETAPTNSPPARPNPTTSHVTSRSPSPLRPPSAAPARSRPLLPVRPRCARAPVPARHLLHHPSVCPKIVTGPSTRPLTKPWDDGIRLGPTSYALAPVRAMSTPRHFARANPSPPMGRHLVVTGPFRTNDFSRHERTHGRSWMAHLHQRLLRRHVRTQRRATSVPLAIPSPPAFRRPRATTPPAARPPSLRSGSRPRAAPAPPSGSVPEDRYHPVNAVFDQASGRWHHVGSVFP